MNCSVSSQSSMAMASVILSMGRGYAGVRRRGRGGGCRRARTGGAPGIGDLETRALGPELGARPESRRLGAAGVAIAAPSVRATMATLTAPSVSRFGAGSASFARSTGLRHKARRAAVGGGCPRSAVALCRAREQRPKNSRGGSRKKRLPGIKARRAAGQRLTAPVVSRFGCRWRSVQAFGGARP